MSGVQMYQQDDYKVSTIALKFPTDCMNSKLLLICVSPQYKEMNTPIQAMMKGAFLSGDIQ